MSVFISYRPAMDRNAISIERLTVLANAQWTSLQVPFEQYISEFFSAFSKSPQLGRILTTGVQDANRFSLNTVLQASRRGGSSGDLRKSGAIFEIACDLDIDCLNDEMSGCMPQIRSAPSAASAAGVGSLDFLKTGSASADQQQPERAHVPAARCIFFWTVDGGMNAHIAPTFGSAISESSTDSPTSQWHMIDYRRPPGISDTPAVVDRTSIFDRRLAQSCVCILYCHGIDFPFIENTRAIDLLPMQIDSCQPQLRKRGLSSHSGKSPIVYSDSSQSMVSMHRRPERSLRKLFKLKEKMSVAKLARQPKPRDLACTVLPFPGAQMENVAQIQPDISSNATELASANDVAPWGRPIDVSLLEHVSLRNLGRNIRRMREERERRPLLVVSQS